MTAISPKKDKLIESKPKVWTVPQVILMFVISLTGRAPTILNYRSKVQNEYSEWEEELKAREDLIQEREHELGISEEDK